MSAEARCPHCAGLIELIPVDEHASRRAALRRECRIDVARLHAPDAQSLDDLEWHLKLTHLPSGTVVRTVNRNRQQAEDDALEKLIDAMSIE